MDGIVHTQLKRCKMSYDFPCALAWMISFGQLALHTLLERYDTHILYETLR